MRSDFLPFARPDIGEEEEKEVLEVLRSGWLTTGPKTRTFEAQFARHVGVKHAVAVNSCTAAMHLALEAIGLGPGDEVITTPYTFAATAEVVRYFDAKPVFVDIRSDDLNLDPALLEPAITPRTRAIIPVHIGGLPAAMDTIAAIAAASGLAVIEDAAHAFPARCGERAVGSPLTSLESSAHLVCFSFYATKTLTTGEGGMITTNDEDLAQRCRVMALHGMSRDAWKRYTSKGSWYYEIIAPGFKYNMTDLAAAMGIVQLRKAETMRRRREAIARRYNEAYGAVPELQIPHQRLDCEHAWHLYMLRLHLARLRIDRARFVDELKSRNVGCSVHFIPLHLHPYYRETYAYQPQDLPIAYRQYQREISLPIYSTMTEDDVQDVVDAVLDIVEMYRRQA